MAQEKAVTTTEARLPEMTRAVDKWLSDNERAIALPPNIDVARLKFATRLVMARNKVLQNCTAESLLNSILTIASWGLYPGPLAHIVPFGKEAVPILDYKGMEELIVANSAAVKVEAEVVRESDDFWYTRGTSPQIHHVPANAYRSNDRWTHVYAIVFYPDGVTRFEVMDHAEVMAVKKRSPSVSRNRPSPWDTDEVEMAKKTVVRRLAKTTPKQTTELQQALEFEDRLEAGALSTPYTQSTAQIAPVEEPAPEPTGDPEKLQEELDDLYDNGQGKPPAEGEQATFPDGSPTPEDAK